MVFTTRAPALATPVDARLVRNPGLSPRPGHNPLEVEAKDWDADYCMTALYYMIRPRTEFQKILGEVPLGEIYLRSDRQRMMETIGKTQKPCLTYRPLSSFVRS
jgi:hypothetical protein